MKRLSLFTALLTTAQLFGVAVQAENHAGLAKRSTSTVYVTSTTVFTYFTTKAATTTTVPTPSNWTPIISAATAKVKIPPGGGGDRRRDAIEPRKPSKEGIQLAVGRPRQRPREAALAEENNDSTPHTPTVTSTTTKHVFTTSTLHHATATVYAGCAPDNIIKKFKGLEIADYATFSYSGGYVAYPFSGDETRPHGDFDRAAGQSPEACCNAIWANAFSGFMFSGVPGYSSACYGWAASNDHAVWDFYTGTGVGGLYVGNGVRPQGRYAGNLS